MGKLLIVFVIALLLAYASDRYRRQLCALGHSGAPRYDPPLILLIVLLCLFTGLRTAYNDTENYAAIFRKTPLLGDLFADRDNLKPFSHPLFYAYMSLLRTLGFGAQAMILTTSVFTQTCLILFLRRYSDDLMFSVFLYFTLGTFCMTMAAIKQALGMALVTLALPCLQRREWGKYYAWILLATLTHAYAAVFALLPLFAQRPWRVATITATALTLVALLGFYTILGIFADLAESLGVPFSKEELFDGHTVSPLRLAVYAVVPMCSLLFDRSIRYENGRMDYIFVQMSILSMLFMCPGIRSGANLFGRMANYFEMGSLLCFPWMLRRTFTRESRRMATALAILCFLAYFFYANGIHMRFDSTYRMLFLS